LPEEVALKYRVLVVEDHEWWRGHICSALEQSSRWTVVGAVADGIEAVEKARELKPDLILVDVGLLSLDGIQAARRILAHDPSSRILFVTEQQSLDIAEVALATGARGYIVKSDVGRELLLAMEAVVAGERFISPKLAGRVLDTTNDGRLARETRRHEVGFYANESSLLDDYATFAEAALNAGNSLIILVTGSRRDGLHQRLQERGIDIDRTIAERTCLWVDVPAALSSFVVDRRVDEARFWNVTSGLIMEAARASKRDLPRVSACGECAPTLLQEGLADAAIRLEQLWDDVARTYNVDIFCAYSSHGLRCDDESPVFRDLRAAHSAVHVR
jgi:DNA-binding NarL/FixJ family response regulator